MQFGLKGICFGFRKICKNEFRNHGWMDFGLWTQRQRLGIEMFGFDDIEVFDDDVGILILGW